MLLIVGLGNPGKAYENTRHNMGWRIVKKMAEKKPPEGVKVKFLLPSTYMNSSGEEVKVNMDDFKLGLKDLLIVCDDVALPFGKLRLRDKGSSGGHNGLKSIEEHLSSQIYSRLKVGVDAPVEGIDLADYVLSRFTPEETAALPEIEERAIVTIEEWIKRRM